MNDIGIRIFVFAMGAGAGYIYFGGLWLTLNYLPKVRGQIRLVVASYFFRLTMMGATFYWITTFSDWIGILSCLAGVLLMRTIFVSRMRGEVTHLAALKR